MVKVIGVSFKRAGKVYYFDPGDWEIHDGMPVIVETVRGVEYAQATGEPFDIDEDKIVSPLKSVIRLGTEKDTLLVEQNKQKEVEAFAIAQKKIEEHQLEMKLIDVEYTFDAGKIIFYFTANGRVDFRELVKDLAYIFKTRIELKQIGVRDEAKMLGGLGPCGRPICCKAFLFDFQPVSIKMAKEQNLSLNPVKISGLCGRLMCCLKYEEDAYEQIHKESPKIGKEVQTIDGRGVVTEINVMKETVTVHVALPDQTFNYIEYPLSQFKDVKDEEAVPSIENIENKEDAQEVVHDKQEITEKAVFLPEVDDREEPVSKNEKEVPVKRELRHNNGKYHVRRDKREQGEPVPVKEVGKEENSSQRQAANLSYTRRESGKEAPKSTPKENVFSRPQRPAATKRYPNHEGVKTVHRPAPLRENEKDGVKPEQNHKNGIPFKKNDIGVKKQSPKKQYRRERNESAERGGKAEKSFRPNRERPLRRRESKPIEHKEDK